MKKYLKTFVALLLCLILCLTLFSCYKDNYSILDTTTSPLEDTNLYNEESSKDNHSTESNTYGYDEDNHWLICDWCGEAIDFESHIDSNEDGTCDVCNTDTLFTIEVLSDDTCEIVSYNGINYSSLTNLVIPESINDLTVIALGDNSFEGAKYLEEVVIADSVETLGESTFLSCTSLTTIVLPLSVISIGSNSFTNTKLTTTFYKGSIDNYSSVNSSDSTLDDTIHYYEEDADSAGCSSWYYDEKGNYTLYESCLHTYGDWIIDTEATCTNEGSKHKTCECGHEVAEVIEALGHSYEQEEDADKYYSDEYNHWKHCTVCNEDLLTEAHIDADVDNMCDVCGCELSVWTYSLLDDGTYQITAYTGDTSVTELEVPTTYKGIEITEHTNGILSELASLEMLSFAFVGSNTYLGYLFGEEKFNNNYLILPNVLKKIVILGDNLPSNAFYLASQIEEIVINDNLMEIPAYAFAYCYKLNSINLPSTITSIGNYAFYNAKVLTKLIIPEYVESIGQYAFANCASLKTIHIPEKIQTIESRTFSECTALTNITMTNNINTIDSYTFYCCSALPSISLSEKISSIGEGAFW